MARDLDRIPDILTMFFEYISDELRVAAGTKV